jgi:hypothetical protein
MPVPPLGHFIFFDFYLNEATGRIELPIEVLQTSALPLGYVAIFFLNKDKYTLVYFNLFGNFFFD